MGNKETATVTDREEARLHWDLTRLYPVTTLGKLLLKKREKRPMNSESGLVRWAREGTPSFMPFQLICG